MQQKSIQDHKRASTSVSKRLKKIGVACSIFSILFSTTSPVVFAEVDPNVLMSILSQLAGTGVVISTGTTTASGANTTTNTTNTTTSSNTTDRLSITTRSTGKAGEMMDVTVKALTKDGNVATGYRGTIFISVDNDYQATVPYMDGYAFTSQDQGVKVFPKGLSFSKAGTFKVSVFDFAQAKVSGSTSVVISAATVATTTTTQTPTVTPTTTSNSAGDNTTGTPAVVTASGPVSFKIGKVEIGDKKATITFQVLNDNASIRKFEFLYADPEGNSKKALTFEKEKIKNQKGEYVWYIPNLELTKYVISISGIDKDGETVLGATSQPFEANLSVSAAGKCIIPNVSGLRVLKKQDSSVLYWDNIPEAAIYKVYKKDASGEYVFLEETKKDSYTVHISDGSVKYEDFSVKAVCSDGTESLTFAPSTSVQTGPKELVALLVFSGLIAWLIIRKRRKKLGLL